MKELPPKNISVLPLPNVGLSRWNQLRYFIPVCRETWRKLVLNGKAPQPIRLTDRCTFYSNEEIHRWLSDPTGYSVATEGVK